ncbi:unannotated protein [freshwater metagenome]|uniref:Unannotated protein n=1 Tax=freshwater metagenome TaxID=449393 RepID=A0A6J7S785_9ZZZZ
MELLAVLVGLAVMVAPQYWLKAEVEPVVLAVLVVMAATVPVVLLAVSLRKAQLLVAAAVMVPMVAQVVLAVMVARDSEQQGP